MHSLYDYTSANKILKCAAPQVVPTKLQKNIKNNLRSLNLYSFAGPSGVNLGWPRTRCMAGPLTTWVAKRRRPVSSSGDQWRQRTFLSWPNCKIWSIQRMILHVLYLDELHSSTTKASGWANIGCQSTFPLKHGANCWLQLTTDTKQSHRFWIQQYVCR